MAIFRIEKTADYTTMSNRHFKDKRLSLKSKGLLSQMLSLPENWDYTLKGLAHINRESIDAIGKTINHVGNRHKYAPDSEVPSKTMVVIITDGYENASREFDLNKVKHMIEHQKEKYNWEFLFLGANIDAVQTAGTFGINADRAVTYQPDSVGTRTNFDAVSETVACMRAERPIDKSWKNKIESYMKKKQK